jgi:hypothetical protein
VSLQNRHHSKLPEFFLFLEERVPAIGVRCPLPLLGATPSMDPGWPVVGSSFGDLAVEPLRARFIRLVPGGDDEGEATGDESGAMAVAAAVSTALAAARVAATVAASMVAVMVEGLDGGIDEDDDDDDDDDEEEEEDIDDSASWVGEDASLLTLDFLARGVGEGFELFPFLAVLKVVARKRSRCVSFRRTKSASCRLVAMSARSLLYMSVMGSVGTLQGQSLSLKPSITISPSMRRPRASSSGNWARKKLLRR